MEFNIFLQRQLAARSYLLNLLSHEDLLRLRLCSHDCKDLVASCNLDLIDVRPIIGRISTWRAIFPLAKCARLQKRKDVTDEDVAHLAGISCLSLFQCSSLTDAVLLPLASTLTDLTVRDCSALTDSCFVGPAGAGGPAAFPSLRRIQLIAMSKVTGIGIEDAAPNLQEVCLTRCKGLLTVHLSKLVSLTTFTLEDCHFISETGAQVMFTGAPPSLTTLSISDCPSLNDDAFVDMPHVKRLRITATHNYWKLTDAVMSHFVNLTSLELHNMYEMTDAALTASCRWVEQLDIKSCHGIEGNVLRNLPRLKQLYWGYMPGCDGSQFDRLEAVQDLTINCVKPLGSLQLRRMPSMTSLYLGYGPIKNDALDGLPATVHTATISNCYDLADVVFRQLADVRSLVIDFSGPRQCELTDAAFQPLRSLQHLTLMTRAKFTTQGIAKVAALQGLTSLEVNLPSPTFDYETINSSFVDSLALLMAANAPLMARQPVRVVSAAVAKGQPQPVKAVWSRSGDS